MALLSPYISFRMPPLSRHLSQKRGARRKISGTHALADLKPTDREENCYNRTETGAGWVNKTSLYGGGALADCLDERLVLDVIGVIGLDLDGQAGEGALQGLLGGGVDHLGL